MAERKWEIRGASDSLRQRVKAAAKARSMGQGAWVIEAIEAHLLDRVGRNTETLFKLDAITERLARAANTLGYILELKDGDIKDKFR